MSIRNFDIDPQTIAKLPLMQTSGGLRLLHAYEQVDYAIVGFLRSNGATVLRFALATVFLWFGALKLIDRSPVARLVADTVAWFPEGIIVPALGAAEVAIGVGLLLHFGLRIVLLLFVLQMLGTFLVFITQPGAAFQDGNPLLLTTLGEFVVKNLVLIAAGLAVGSTVRGNEPRETE